MDSETLSILHETADSVADRAVQVHGGAGYMADYQVECLYRDVRVLRICGGTSQIQMRDAGLKL